MPPLYRIGPVRHLGPIGVRLTVRKQTLRFIIETASDANVAQVTAAAREHLHPEASVTPLFREVPATGDPEALRRFFAAVIPVATSGMAQGKAFDLAYAAREKAALFADVEPDLWHSLYVPQSGSKTPAGDPDDSLDRGWSLRAMKVKEAWALQPPTGGQMFGIGIKVGHPDTGWSLHDDLDQDRLDLNNSHNTMNDSSDAEDHMMSIPIAGTDLDHPGHGTGTGSVIMSGGRLLDPPAPGDEGGTGPSGKISGVAPGARLLPVKCVDSVVLVGDATVSSAVNWAVRNNSHVLSISLGGTGSSALHSAIRDAVKKHVIVIAAAGNNVGLVVFPALYPESIAVAASNVDGTPWTGSSRGPMVTITAPGGGVWRAEKTAVDGPTDAVDQGHGTSFAVANVAGVAALWLAFHGRQQLIDRYDGTATLQQVFTKVLEKSTPRPSGWNTFMLGYGIIDAEAVLKEPLPDMSGLPGFNIDQLNAFSGGHLLPTGRLDWFDVLRRLFPELSADELRRRLAVLLNVAEAEVRTQAQSFGMELVQLFMENEQAARRFGQRATADVQDAANRVVNAVVDAASQALKAATGWL